VPLCFYLGVKVVRKNLDRLQVPITVAEASFWHPQDNFLSSLLYTPVKRKIPSRYMACELSHPTKNRDKDNGFVGHLTSWLLELMQVTKSFLFLSCSMKG
jgi:hypothetical protein